MLAVRGHIAVIPGGAELGQIDGHDLVDVDELAGFAKRKELALEKGPQLLAGGVFQATSLLILQERANRIFDGRTAGLHLIDAGGISLGFLLPSISFGLFPASCPGRLTDGLSIGQNSRSHFGQRQRLHCVLSA